MDIWSKQGWGWGPTKSSSNDLHCSGNKIVLDLDGLALKLRMWIQETVRKG